MTITDLPTASFWRPGDPMGHRRLTSVGPVTLELGGSLPDVTVAYETWGTLNRARDNAVLVEHALTGDSHVEGPAGAGHPTAGWWDGLIGPGRPLDTDRFFVVASNVLGGCQGTTGPSSEAPDARPWGSRFPAVTIRDQVAVEARLADQLGVSRWAGVLGGSMGGMRAIEWATTHPGRVAACIVLASTAYATADQIAWCQPQLLAIRSDPHFHGGDYYGHGVVPAEGRGLARPRPPETDRPPRARAARVVRAGPPRAGPLGRGGRFAVESYLDHHAGKLGARFDANSYVVLSEAMNSHDVGRGRGGVAAALAAFTGRLVVAGVDTDRLYPERLSDEIAALRPGTIQRRVTSRFGHDGFLIEIERVGEIIRDALADDLG